MVKIIGIILVLSLIGNLVGMYFFYKYIRLKRDSGYDRDRLSKAVQDLTAAADRYMPDKMVFLHHSVGLDMLSQGGLRDSLFGMGIMVKSATYGDDIGNGTDVCDWLPKFRRDIDKMLTFKMHPNLYYNDGTENAVIMFKSCFPNSQIVADGTPPGDPSDTTKTMANYKAVFGQLKDEIRKHGDKLFIYLTAPPLRKNLTNPENARRAQIFNRWLVDEFLPEYCKETGLNNWYIFDLSSTLADSSGFLKPEFCSSNPRDSHPNQAGSQFASTELMKFFRPVWQKWHQTSAAGRAGRT